MTNGLPPTAEVDSSDSIFNAALPPFDEDFNPCCVVKTATGSDCYYLNGMMLSAAAPALPGVLPLRCRIH